MDSAGSAWPAVVAIVLLGASCSTPTLSQPGSSSNTPRKHVSVRFTDMALRPETARIEPGGSVIWINDATIYLGVVYFDASIREKFTCSELRPLFYQVAGGYQSLPIQKAAESVRLPCPLRPGSYDYELRLFQSEAGMPAGPAGTGGPPDARMPGKIVVE